MQAMTSLGTMSVHLHPVLVYLYSEYIQTYIQI